MLVLSRKVGQDIIIGVGDTKIIVRVTDVDNTYRTASIGIEAAAHIPVNRRELFIKKFPDDELSIADLDKECADV